MKKPSFKQQKKEDQIIWKNTTHDVPFNPTTNWYGCIEFEKAPTIKVEYTCRVRSEAVRIFEEESRLLGGKLGVVSAYK